MPDATPIAIISNEPTPYRLHVLRRLVRELPEAAVHNVFTHRLHDASMPWQVQVEPELRPVYFEDAALANRPRDWRRANRLFARIRDYLIEHDMRLVILLGYNDLARLRLIRWAASRNLPLLLTADSNVYSDALLSPWKRWAKRQFVRRVVRDCAGLMPMGACGRAYFRLYADHDKPTFLFPYEPDYQALQTCSDERQQAFMQAHGLDPDRKRMLYCGRLVPVKHVDVLIDAFVQMAGDRPDWDLVIAGDGPLRAGLESRVPAALRQRVRFLGFLQFGQTVEAYHCCDLLVHPSGYEPWGLVINEAVACGLAVVATDVTGAAAELVRPRENGILVRPGDRRALAEALRQATDLRTLTQMKSQSGDILKHWRQKADPVQGVRAAMRHFGLLPE